MGKLNAQLFPQSRAILRDAVLSLYRSTSRVKLTGILTGKLKAQLFPQSRAILRDSVLSLHLSTSRGK